MFFTERNFCRLFCCQDRPIFNRIYTFQDVPIDSCGCVSMPIFLLLFLSVNIIVIFIERSTAKRFVAIPKTHWDYFGVGNKENGDHFGVDLGTTALFRVGHHIGVRIFSGAAQNQTVPLRYYDYNVELRVLVSLFRYSSQLPVFPKGRMRYYSKH